MEERNSMNIIDYLNWRGDIPFSCKPFNVVDNLILTELAYVNMDGILSEEFVFDTSLSQLLAKYRVARLTQKGAHNNPIPLLEKAAYCERYQDIRLGGYLNILDETDVIQIAAVTFKLDDATIYVAYRGTDHTMTGWREDFNFGYLSETPGQAHAVTYLENACDATGCRAYVGGHSKGGNFAVYAAAFARSDIKREKLINVFSNDGPGFKKTIVESPEYISITNKIIKTVPEASIIGMLLFGREKFNIIKCDGKGMEQHSPYRWQIFRDSFVPTTDLTYKSAVMDLAFDRWVENLDDEKRGIVITTLFDAIETAGYSTINELLENKITAYNAIAKAAKTLDEEDRKSTIESLKELAAISKDILWDDAKKKFMPKKQERGTVTR